MSDVNKSIGGQNRYTFTCDYVEQKRYYGVCLWLMKSFEEGKLQFDERREDCGTAMKCAKCPAMKMRAEEIAADKAIYYTDPENPPAPSTSKVDKTSPSYIRGWNQVGSSIGREDSNIKQTIPTKVAAKPQPKQAQAGVLNADVGALISAELKKEKLRSEAIQELKRLRDEIQEVMKTNPTKARELLLKAKTIKDTLTA
jgi:hypothetical protein